jgi:hypothetical protein
MVSFFSTQDNCMMHQTQKFAEGTGKIIRRAGEKIVMREARQSVRNGAIGKGLDSFTESISKGSKKIANTAHKIAQKGRNIFRKNNTKGIKNFSQNPIPSNTKNNAVAQANANNPPVTYNNKSRSNRNNPSVSAKKAATLANANNAVAQANANNHPVTYNNKSRSNRNNPLLSAKKAATLANANNHPVDSNNNSRSIANTVTGSLNQSNINEELKNLNTTNLAQSQIAVTSGGSRKKSKKSHS